MMGKPKAIQWLEDQTGERIEYTAEPRPPAERHLSVRVSDELAQGLEALATERNLSLSQLVRVLLAEALDRRASVATLDAQALVDRLSDDVAEVKRRLAG